MTENKVTSIHEARAIFDLLGIKEVTKEWQHKQGTQVFELPFKTMYYNGHAEINRFSIYKSGYVRKMVVHPTKGTSYSCYQLNKTRKTDEYFKDYEWNDDYTEQTWTGKYRKSNRIKRIMIDTHEDRYVYLCNYILKNYYRNSKCNLVGEYTMKRVTEVHDEWWKANKNDYQSPFVDKAVDRILENNIDDVKIEGKYSEVCDYVKDDIQVIINGHRYNLS